MILLSNTQLTYYAVTEFLAIHGGALLTMRAFKEYDLSGLGASGVYWTGTRVSCSRQVVAIFKDGEISFSEYDKTFSAGLIYDQ
jgi:hypothetical protein